MSLYLVGMAERRLTKWQEKWMLIEDESGDQVGEYLRKTDQENATCDWCKVTFKYCMSGVTAIKQHAKTGKHIDVADTETRLSGAWSRSLLLMLKTTEKETLDKLLLCLLLPHFGLSQTMWQQQLLRS